MIATWERTAVSICGIAVSRRLAGLLIIGASFLMAAVATPGLTRAGDPGFEKDVLPILETKCNRCHGGKSRGGQLDLRTLDALMKGGVTGPAIKKGDSKKSLMIEMMHYNEMPPKKEKQRVTKDELDLMRKWVDTGATP